MKSIKNHYLEAEEKQVRKYRVEFQLNYKLTKLKSLKMAIVN